MSRQLAILGVGILAVVLIAGCQAGKTQAPAAPTPAAVETPETDAVLETVVNADGTLVSTQPTLGLGFQVSGRVIDVLVQPGDSVKAGQVLARLDTLTLHNTVRDATARLEQSRFSLDKARRAAAEGTDLAAAGQGVEAARLGIVNARGTYSSTLLRADVTTEVQNARFWADYWGSELDGFYQRLQERPQSEKRREEYEQAGIRAANAHQNMLQIQQDARNQLTAAQRSLATAQQTYLSALSSYTALKSGDAVRQAELQVQLDETALTRAQMDLANAELKAPWDAMVDQVNIAPGGQVGGTPALTLVDVGHVQFVTTNLSERDLGHVAVGQQVSITLKAFPDARLSGTVAAIAPLSGQAVGDAATFTVRVDLDPTDLTLRPGMTGQVEIVVE